MPSLLRTCLAVAAMGLLAGCGTAGSGAGSTQPEPTAEPTGLPTSYSFVLTSSCGERGLLGDFDVTVRDGRVVLARDRSRDFPYEPRTDEVPTLQDLLDRAEAAPDEGEVHLQLDAAGRPVSLELDPVPMGIDDEECYRVSDLEVTG